MVTVQIRTALGAAAGSEVAAGRLLRGLSGFVLLLLTSMLLACVGPGTPVVSDRSVGDRSQQTYTVRRGDTLYSIAWRFDLDHRRLAAANKIRAPFTIFQGSKYALQNLWASQHRRLKKPLRRCKLARLNPALGCRPSLRLRPPLSSLQSLGSTLSQHQAKLKRHQPKRQ